MNLADFLNHFDKKRKTNASWMVLCPAHDDKTPSLSIKEGEKGIVLKCFAGCDPEQVVAAMGLRMSDLFFDSKPPGTAQVNGTKPAKRIVATYDYTDESGALLHQTVRYSNKTFSQRRPDGKGRWVWNLDTRVVLYRLPEVLASPVVYVVEGEKDVETLRGHDLPATCNPMGAGNWRESYNDSLRGKTVVILPDNDDPGRQHARQVAKSLHGIADEVVIVELPNLPLKGDVTDYFERGGTVDELNRLVAAAKAFDPTEAETVKEQTESVNGEKLFDEIERFIRRFVSYPSDHALVAHVLWIVHTWLMNFWDSTPRLAALSTEPASGKSRVLEVSEPLVPRPIHAVNATPAYLFRKVSDPGGAPTLLYDEIDTIFGPKAKDNEDVRGMLNAGHRKGAMAGRCVTRGKIIETEELPAYCAVALAGLNDLPDTLMSRSVVIRMRRRAPAEKIEPWRQRANGLEAAPIAERLQAWAAAITSVTFAEPPPGVEDRNADVWEALLTVAEIAGGKWPARARAASVALVADAKRDAPSLGVQLLSDLRTVFGEDDHLSTDVLLRRLLNLPESRWADLRGKPLDARSLARILRRYDVKPGQIREGSSNVRGYLRADLEDPWLRYLPAVDAPDGGAESANANNASDATSRHESATSATDATCSDCGVVLDRMPSGAEFCPVCLKS